MEQFACLVVCKVPRARPDRSGVSGRRHRSVASLFTDLTNSAVASLKVIEKTARSSEEDAIVALYAEKVRDLRVRQAEVS